jgi:hypothetical protein
MNYDAMGEGHLDEGHLDEGHLDEDVWSVDTIIDELHGACNLPG